MSSDQFAGALEELTSLLFWWPFSQFIWLTYISNCLRETAIKSFFFRGGSSVISLFCSQMKNVAIHVKKSVKLIEREGGG